MPPMKGRSVGGLQRSFPAADFTRRRMIKIGLAGFISGLPASLSLPGCATVDEKERPLLGWIFAQREGPARRRS